MERQTPGLFVGRETPLSQLASAVDGARAGRVPVVLVSGEAGIGKSSLVAEAVRRAAGVDVGLGTCWAGPGAPGYWPWTQALGGLVSASGAEATEMPEADRRLLSGIIPAFGPAPVEAAEEGAGRARLRLFDAVCRWLVRLGRQRPVMVVLDDLHWADLSSLELLDFLARSRPGPGVLLVGLYRHDELSPTVSDVLGALTSHAEHIHLSGLSVDEVGDLVTQVAGRERADRWAAEVYQRSEGHPFFARELVHALADAAHEGVPRAVRGAIQRRLDRLSPPTRAVVDVAALLGNRPHPDVVSGALAVGRQAVDDAIGEAMGAGVLAGGRDRPRFVHDLFREAVIEALPTADALDIHHRLARALEARHARAADVAPSEIAGHATAAVSMCGPEVALRWALAAATADQGRLALAEAAAHLTRLRGAITEASVSVDDSIWVDLLVAEADALGRAGRPDAARQLLARARTRADTLGDPARLAAVAFGVQRLGARFAMPRGDVIEVLEAARRAAAVTAIALEARLAAAAARELHHSVPEDRPRAVPLSEQALALARTSNDPAALAGALLARHDVLWTPGTGCDRLEVAREIVGLADRLGDAELRAEGLLLIANALLETGSAAFRPALDAYLAAADALGQPRHGYFALTRRAALMLVDGDLDDAALAIERAAELGEGIGEPDAGNVRMSQLLELTRARGESDEQRSFARRAVEWWTGAPLHAHAVAAGFLARAGDVDAARRELETVMELGTWHTDRSYLWSVYVANLTDAAVTVGDHDLARALLDDLRPLGTTCGVNGAVVAFAGCHGHFAAICARLVGRDGEADELLDQARAVYRRLGARTWQAAADAARVGCASLRARPSPAAAQREAVLTRGDRIWTITYDAQTTTVPDLRGWRDLAVLLARPGIEVHVLELAAATVAASSHSELADRTAIGQYRSRLLDLEDERVEAEAGHDVGRLEALAAEQESILAELHRVTGLGGRARRHSADTAERARKAVSARVRDAIRRLEPTFPELAARLERNVITGAWCRYRGEGDLVWRVELPTASTARRR